MFFKKDQLWSSEMEPELGFGIIKNITDQTVTLYFTKTKISRTYSILSAPIKRVVFKEKDILQTNMISFTVTRVVFEKNLFFYYDENKSYQENEIIGSSLFNSLVDRFKSDKLSITDIFQPEVFDLRYKALELKNKIDSSPYHGFIGGKIDLLPHQIYISKEYTERNLNKILLADEVGLGKTIEACLIIHSFLITGQLNRVLIIVPESLYYQWFSELLKKFNLIFRIVNEKYCKSILNNHENPFYDGELSITSINFLSKHEKYRKMASEADWDLVLVDEAHNIKENTEIYNFIEQLSKKTKKLLLLTATPMQLGLHSHFSRLKLLDPSRYFDYDAFIKEVNEYSIIAILADKLYENKELTKAEEIKLLGYLDDDEYYKEKIELIKKRNFDVNMELLEDLVDRHGIGRVMFRNTRKTITGFPKKVIHISEICTTNSLIQENILKEFLYENHLSDELPLYNYKEDPRIDFIVELTVKKKDEKFLLICHTKEKVLALNEILNKKKNVKTILFHEDLKIIDRDKNAAWFSSKEGAQVLICSEIGSEGRNFQFAGNLILFDYPLSPELLEQRIGRLDRIGQKHTINIYALYIKDTPDEILVKWYHEGLNAFEQNTPDGNTILDNFGLKITELITKKYIDNLEKEKDLNDIIRETVYSHENNLKILDKGRDRLLEINSFNPAKSKELLNELQDIEDDVYIEDFMSDIFEYFGIKESTIDIRSYLLTPGNVKTDAFPKIDEEGTPITYDRKKALSNDRFQFINMDHPYVLRSIELMTGTNTGDISFGIWYSKEKENIFIETVFILECIAPSNLHISRFMPSTPIRIVLDISGKDCTEDNPETFFENVLKYDKVLVNKLLNDEEFINEEIPEILDSSLLLAKIKIPLLINKSVNSMRELYNKNLSRLRYLARINSAVNPLDIAFLESQKSEIENHIKSARIRFDSVRIIWRKSVD